MSRHYGDHVEVRVGDPHEHGVHLDPGWQRSASPDATEVPTLFLWRDRVHVVKAVVAQWVQRTPWWRAHEHPEILEHQVWRVEASAGRAHGTGVYDLVHGEHWLLERVTD